MGVSIQGSLGQTEEIEFSAEQFKKLWVNANREKLQNFFNELASICGVNATLTINETDILTVKEVAEIKEEGTPEEMASEKSTVNDALKGLTAQQNMDMIRIVRDYTKGKLSKPLARTRLAAYGIDADTINEILQQ